MYGFSAVCVAPFAFNGRWIDLPIAFVMGCILGVMQLVAAPSSELYTNVFEISAALLMSFLGRMFGYVTRLFWLVIYGSPTHYLGHDLLTY